MKENNRGMAENGRSSVFHKLIEYGPFALALAGFLCCLVVEVSGVYISRENRNLIYDVVCLLTTVFGMLLNAFYGKHYGLAWRKALGFSFIEFLLLFICLAEVWTRLDILMFGAGSTAAFRSLIFLPLLCQILSRFCAQDTLNLCDFFTPYFFYTLGFTALTCWIAGCCAGKPWSWGLTNPLSGMTVFPTQPCIVLSSLAVAFWGLQYSKKHAYKTNGKVFANSLCLYGIGRYVIELFSDDPRVWWVLSWFAICSLAMIAEGFVVRFIANKHYKTLS